MLLRTVYAVRPSAPERRLDLDVPLPLALADEVRAVVSVGDEGELRLVMERRVDPTALEVAADTEDWELAPEGWEEPPPSLQLRRDQRQGLDEMLGTDVVSALSFLTDLPMSLSHATEEDRFVAEDDADRATLQALGTDRAHAEVHRDVSVRSLARVEVTPELVHALQPRRTGLRLYADALKLGPGVAQFRELWRILESAFDLQDDKLVAVLADYPPAQAMGFDAEELQALLVLRGRASHAASRASQRELLTVTRQCLEGLARLKNLAERVILTKASWGTSARGVSELLPLAGYVRRVDSSAG
ncbi:MAG TPA: hypothetical protein VFU54_19800 [Actinomycetota bacterium]|nr:hypothetical protein [Actinomycetota bacterium]